MVLSINNFIAKNNDFKSFCVFFIYRLFIDIYGEYYSVRLLSKMSGYHCAYFAFLSKHMARVDCRG